MIATPPFESADVSAAFARFAGAARPGLLALRNMIFAVAADTPGVGPVHETLKWGQPAYLTPETRAGSTLRLGVPKSGGYAIFMHCQTTIIADFRALFADDFSYDGTRAVLFDAQSTPDTDKLCLLISSALTYHLK
jgi:hypothetical protein